MTTLGAGVDGSVRRIDYAYDSQGNLSLITSYDAPTGGNIVNQVSRQFNGLGQLTAEYEGHHGAVDTSSNGTVQTSIQYAYNEMANGENNSRLVSITYPSTYANARYTLSYNYAAGLDDRISRLTSLSDNSPLSNGALESYKYLGLDTIVERDHLQTNINQTYISQSGQTGDAGDQYVGLDRFGRVVNDNWLNATTGQSTDDFGYGYNADGDVLYKQNLVDAAMSELYQYNNLHELVNFQRGTLNATQNGIVGTPSRSQSWSPDALGNFDSVTSDGSTQTRTANQQNQITSISGSGTISYDGNGNLTADGSGTSYVYDAWNRLVAVRNNGTTVANYGYDGLGHRITETHGTDVRELYYSAQGQVLTEWYDGQEQARNVWSPVYVNALVVRDQASQNNGVLNQRMLVQQDANWNVTALVNQSATVGERYAYDPYGVQTVLNAAFSVRGASIVNVPYGFQGMRSDALVGQDFAANRVYDPDLERWLQTDPIGLSAGNNDYAIEGNDPADNIDPSGLQIYVITGANDPTIACTNVPNPINQSVHQDIAVDTWEKKGDRWVKTGREYYTFAANGSVSLWVGPTWLGMGTSWTSTWVTGEVQNVTKERKVGAGTVVSLLQSTPEQDSEFKLYLDGFVGKKDGYSVARHNCRLFSQWMFQKAHEKYPHQKIIHAK